MKTVLITGASAGIGAEFARHYATRGANVLLVARSADKLQALCAELSTQHKIDAQFVALDLGAPDAPQQLWAETQKRGLEVETLINNAGFGAFGDFTQIGLERQQAMIDLNIKSLVALTHLYAPGMRSRRTGTIINVASTAAFQGVPFMNVYAATKAFVLAFSEALWAENQPHGVHVMALCPGATETNFFEAAQIGERPPFRAFQTPAQVIATSDAGLRAGKSHTVSGWPNRLMIFAERFAPRWLIQNIAGRAMRQQYGRMKDEG